MRNGAFLGPDGMVRADSPLRSGADLLAHLRDPASVTLARSTALGNPNHIAVVQVTRAAGGDITAPAIRVFDMALDAVADVVAGHALFAAVTAASAIAAMESGQVRTIAVSAPDRLPGVFADCPTWTEQSVPCVVGAWRGATGPHGLDPDQVAFWEGVLTRATQSPVWREDLARHCWAPMLLTGDALRQHLRQEYKDYADLLGSLGLLAREG